MRAWIFSDLHSTPLEDAPPAVPTADVAIVAGDVSEWSVRAPITPLTQALSRLSGKEID